MNTNIKILHNKTEFVGIMLKTYFKLKLVAKILTTKI